MPQDVKNRRVFEMAQVYRAGVEELNAACVGQKQLILIEGVSKSIDFFTLFHSVVFGFVSFLLNSVWEFFNSFLFSRFFV